MTSLDPLCSSLSLHIPFSSIPYRNMYGLIMLFLFLRESLRALRHATNPDKESSSSEDRIALQHCERLLKRPWWIFVVLFILFFIMDLLIWGLPILLLAVNYARYVSRLHTAAAHVERRFYSSLIELHASELGWSNAVTAAEIPRVTCSDNGVYCGTSLRGFKFVS